MNKKIKSIVGIVIVLCVLISLPQTATAQFGKNMVVKEVNWKIYESPHFKIYYYFPNKEDWTKEKEYIQDMIRWTETAYKQISEKYDYDMPVNNPKHGKPRIFFYWSRYDARHHPLGPGSAIAYAEPLQMRMICVSKEFPDEKIQQIVTHETTHLFQFSLWKLVKKSLSRLSRIWRRLLTFIFEGWSQHESRLHITEPNAQLVLRYWVLNGGLRYINIKDWIHPALSRSYEICYVIAPYFFDYIKETYGNNTFVNFVKEFRRIKPTAKGFAKVVTRVLKTDFVTLDRGFRKYLEDQYKYLRVEKKEALEYGRDILVERKLIKSTFTKKKVNAAYEAVISPIGELIAAYTVGKDRIQVSLISIKDGTVIKNLTHGYSLYKYGLYPIIDPYGPGRSLCFSPDGDRILYFAQTASRYPVLILFKISTGKIKKIKIELTDPESPEISKDGKIVLFSAIKNGQRDIFELNLATKKIKNLTNDKQFNYAPTFSPDEKTIIYVASVANYKKLFILDVATKTKKQLTFGPSNEIRPIYSKDGKIIWFISDQDKYKTKNVYSFDLASNKIRQWTDVINGVQTVVPMQNKKILIGAVGYRDSRHLFTNNLYEVNLKEIKTVGFANNLLTSKKIKLPEKIKLKIKEIDSKKIKKYKPKLLMNRMIFYGGFDSWYGWFGYGYAHMTDLTRTKHLMVSLMNFSDWYKSNSIAYFSLSKRLGWGIVATYDNHHLYPWWASSQMFISPYGKPAYDDVLYQLWFEQALIKIIGIYPLDLCHRIEFSLNANSTKYQHPDWQALYEAYGNPLYKLRQELVDKHINDGKFLSFNVAFIRDTALFKRSVGPFAGNVFRLDLSYSSGNHNKSASFEARKYLRMGRQGVFAIRLFTKVQNGKTIIPWVVGGLGELRGYKWMQLIGNRAWVINTELRFRLVRNFNLLGIPLGDIRAAFFMDLVKVWFNDARFNKLNADAINPGLIKGSAGIDLSFDTAPILGVPIHISFSRVMTKVKFLPKFDKRWVIKVYLGYSF